MASLKALKLKRQSVNKTRKVTRAMEAVSAVKMRKAQERALAARAYARAALRILSQISDKADFKNTPLTELRTHGKFGLIVITSDKGLAGSLNSAVIKQIGLLIKEKNLTPENTEVICLGRRGNDFLKARDFGILHYEENKRDNVREMDMHRITDIAIEKHLNGGTRAWYMLYTNFESTFDQSAVRRRLFPLSKPALEEVIKSIAPKTGKYSDGADDAIHQKQAGAYEIESEDADDILSELTPLLGNILVYHALLESKASEHSARMVAMKGATDNAGKVAESLKRQFNKARQAAITAEIGEITSGIEAMR